MPDNASGLGDGDGDWIKEAVQKLLAQETDFVQFLPDAQIAKTLVRDTTSFDTFLGYVRAGTGNKDWHVRMLYGQSTLLALGLGVLRAVVIASTEDPTPVGYITVTTTGMGFHQQLDPETVKLYETCIAKCQEAQNARFVDRLNALAETLKTVTPRIPTDHITLIRVEFLQATLALQRLQLSEPSAHWRDATMETLAASVDSLLQRLASPARLRQGGI